MTSAVHRAPIEHPQDIWWRPAPGKPWKRVVSYQKVSSYCVKGGDALVYAANQAARTDAADAEAARIRTEHWNLFGGSFHTGSQPPAD